MDKKKLAVRIKEMYSQKVKETKEKELGKTDTKNKSKKNTETVVINPELNNVPQTYN